MLKPLHCRPKQKAPEIKNVHQANRICYLRFPRSRRCFSHFGLLPQKRSLPLREDQYYESLQIADVFSRMARGQPEGIYSLKIPEIPDLMAQLHELYPQCKTVRSLQKSGKSGELSDFIDDWIQPSGAMPA